MDKQQRQAIYSDMQRGVRPSRLPMDVVGFIEYRKDIYHLGEPEYQVMAGEVGVSKDGTKRFTQDGGVWNLSSKQKYHSYEDVLGMDLSRFPVEDVDEGMLNEMRRLYDEKAITHVPMPWHYGTLLSRCEIEFGWEPLLEASALEPEEFDRVLRRFGESSLAVVEGWCQLGGVDVIIVHDDIASTKGPIWSPAYLRRHIFGWYERIFAKIHEYGKKVLYITDGNYAAIINDILSLGPDGLYCESASLDPEFVMSRGGPERYYLIKTSSYILDAGTEQDVLDEVLKLRRLHERYPRMFSYAGGGTVKPGNLEAFWEYYREYLVYSET